MSISLADARWIRPVQTNAPQRAKLQLVTDDFIPARMVEVASLETAIDAMEQAFGELWDSADDEAVSELMREFFPRFCGFQARGRKLRKERKAG